MFAYELAATVFAEVILFAVSGCARAVAMGTFGFYDDLHNPIVFLYAPVVIALLASIRSGSPPLEF
jgi:hypothetical protein